MNRGQFKDPVSDMCLAGTVVASWSLMQEMAGLSTVAVISNIFITEFAEFRENISGKLTSALLLLLYSILAFVDVLL